MFTIKAKSVGTQARLYLKNVIMQKKKKKKNKELLSSISFNLLRNWYQNNKIPGAGAAYPSGAPDFTPDI